MNKCVVAMLNLLLIFNSILLASCMTGRQPTMEDPSVADKSDMDVIDEYLHSEKSSNKNNNAGGQTAGRDSLGDGTHTPDDNALSTTDQTIRLNDKGELCRCVEYLLCKFTVKEESTTATVVTHTEAEIPPTVEEEEPSNAGTEASQDIEGIADMRKNELVNKNSTCPDDFDVCCPLKDIKQSGTTISTTTTAATTPPSPVIIPSPPPTKPPQPQQSEHHHCGHRNENGVDSPVAVGVQNAQFGEFPFSVAIIQEEKNEENFPILKYVGGGSLLHPQVVLTAAHKVLGKSRASVKVRLGEWDTQTNDEPFPSQDRGVKKIIIHELFLKKTMYNDVALLILDEEARIAPNVDTVCLPPLPKKGKKPISFEGQLCYSASWGMDQMGKEGRYAEIMKKVTVPVMSHEKCEKELKKSEKLPGFRLDKSFMCAGGGETGEDTCKGDGGAPLVCSLRGGEIGGEDGQVHYVQVGVVSWGLGCNSTVYPGVYADIQRLTPWILRTMEKEEMSTEYCTFQ